jgi:hypothetical protein
MPGDFLLPLVGTQRVHSNKTLTRTSLPLAMNLLWVFYSLNSSIFRSEVKKKGRKEKIEVANSKANYEGFR